MNELVWRCRDRILPMGRTTRVMAILNVTPDSFSDGGRFYNPTAAIARAFELIAAGADILDIGGESTRPGAPSVSEEEEIRRTIPVIEAVAREGGDGLISIDTSKASVAARALAAGAHIINDVTALTGDAGMPRVAREMGAGVALMHMKGTPRTMQEAPRYEDVVGEVRAYLAGRLSNLADGGLSPDSMAVDPGIGFGKTVEHNLDLLRHLDALVALGRPVLVGASRKSFLGKITGREVSDRLAASLAAHAYAVFKGAHILRTHDVKETCDLVRIVDTLKAEGFRDADS